MPIRFAFVVTLLATGIRPILMSGADAPKLDKARVEAYLRYAEGYAPAVKITIDDPSPSYSPGYYRVPVHLTKDASTMERIYYTPDGEHLMNGPIWDLNHNPFLEVTEQLPASGFSFGPSDASVTIVVFSDLECPYCRELANTLRSNIPQKYPDDVRVIFEDFPLESIHKWARAAAEAGRCVGNQKPEAFWVVHDWIFQHQQQIDESNLREEVLGLAKKQSLDVADTSNCIDTHATAKEVDQSIKAGQALHVQQTPVFFVNGRIVSGAIPWPTLDAIIQLELSRPNFADTTPKNGSLVSPP